MGPGAMQPVISERRRRGCLSPFGLALLAVACVAGALGLLGYVALARADSGPRTNVLILGLDRRPDESTAVRSDTMVLVTVYPRGEQVGLLSIPRDLYVEIPGYGQDRINTAHFWGENEATPRGPELAMQTVEHNIGLSVDHYVRLDFDGFRAIVDAVGGVDILVESAVVDDAYPTEDYGTVHIEIPAGLQHMDGETALRYARSRHGASDFERAKRQQQVMVAVAERILAADGWATWPAVLAAVLNHTDTDLTIAEMLLLAPTLKRAGPAGIQRLAIDDSMTDPWTTASGAQVLLPRWEAIRPAVEGLFSP